VVVAVIDCMARFSVFHANSIRQDDAGGNCIPDLTIRALVLQVNSGLV
jgi:hypothetical protein